MNFVAKLLLNYITSAPPASHEQAGSEPFGRMPPALQERLQIFIFNQIKIKKGAPALQGTVNLYFLSFY
jgi:hypothetical protein